MFKNFFKSETVDAAIEKIDAGLSELEEVIRAENTKRDVVTTNINEEKELHTLAITALNEEFHRKMNTESNRHNMTDTQLNNKKNELTQVIQRGESFVKTVRGALKGE